MGADNNQPIAKRRVALLRSLGRIPDAVSGLVQLLDFSPNDGEAWSELSEIYFSHGLYPQAIHAMEEVQLLAPNAWNVRLPWLSLLPLVTLLTQLPRYTLVLARCNTWPLRPRGEAKVSIRRISQKP